MKHVGIEPRVERQGAMNYATVDSAKNDYMTGLERSKLEAERLHDKVDREQWYSGTGDKMKHHSVAR